MSEGDLYAGREQTQVKHFILRKYLERFAHIIGFRWTTITYVDCFSGPWKEKSAELKDTSFVIALNELRKARETHRDLRLRCLFLEKAPKAFQKLKEFAATVTDAEVDTLNRELADAVPDIVGFIRKGGSASFPFIFIDPTGWTGFGMETIAPLLRQCPSEVLINFMTDYIRRFIDHPRQQTRDQFKTLFGSSDAKGQIEKLATDQDREDALFRAYATSVKRTGGFSHVCAAIVLYPLRDRSYFHLIYGTRNRAGVAAFKDVEKKAMEVMERARAEVKQHRRVKKTQQPELFASEVMSSTRPIDQLRTRYLHEAKEQVVQLLEAQRSVAYETIWDLALSLPLVWESDVKDWLKEWRTQDLARVEGLRPGQRVPKLDQGITIIWKASTA